MRSAQLKLKPIDKVVFVHPIKTTSPLVQNRPRHLDPPIETMSTSMLPLLLTIYFNCRLVGSHPLRELETMMPASAAVCTTEDQCRQQFSNMSTGGAFNVGDFPTKGCFSKNNNVYFGTGSASEEDLAKTNLPGLQTRIWCDGAAIIPTMMPTSDSLLPTIPTVNDGDGSFFFDVTSVPTFGQQSAQIPGLDTNFMEEILANSVVCLTEEQCQRKFTSMSTGGDFIVGDFPTKGCFAKNSNVYFGTGSTTEEDLADTDLSGTQVRIWCDKETKTPTGNPTLLLATESPTIHPTLMPATASPTTSPSSTSTSALVQQTEIPSQVSISNISSNSPTLHPIAEILSLSPTVSPITMTPSASPGQKTNELASQTNSTSSPTLAKTSSSLVLTPFELSLHTHPGTDTVDIQELKVLVSKHLQTTMGTAFGSADIMKLDINITRILSQPNRRLQPTGFIFANDNTTTHEFDFETSGFVYFSGSSVPNMDLLDRVTLESFSGARGDEFVHSLQNAEDPGLRSTRTVDAETDISNGEEVETVDKLLNQTDDVSVGTDKRLSLLAIVFGVGLLLVAMHVMKTRRGRRIEREKRMNAMNNDIIGDEESPSELEFPTYIEVQKPSEQVNEPSWYDASWYSMPWSFCSQPGIRDESNDTKPAQSVAAHEVPISTDDAPDSDIISTDKSKGLSETMSVFPKDLQTLSGEESDNERNQQALHGWELCGGYGAEQEASNANDTNSSSSEDQNRVTGTVWGQKPSEGVAA